MSTKLILAVGQHTDAGRVRDHNEDNLATVPPEDTSVEVLERKGQLFLVADGMGGHAAGATASAMATRQVMDVYYEDDSDDLRTSLERAIRLANSAIFDQSLDNLIYAGMGTTLVAVVCQDSRFIVANVGDSRAYLVRDGGIRQLTQDHSWVAEAVRQGTLSMEQARHHPRRNVITRSLGNRPDMEVDFFEEGLLPGDVLVLCSDGLSGQVYDEEIRDTVLALEPQAAADQLVNLANERGGPDNITVVIVRAVQTPPAAAPVGGGLPALTILGCLGVLIAAVTLALVAIWALGGWPPSFLVIPTPTATTAPTVVAPTSTSPVMPMTTQTPSPAATGTTTVTPGLPTPSGTSAPYPAPTITEPPATTVIPPYPGPSVAPTMETPATPTTIISPTATATLTATVTPAVTSTAAPTVPGTEPAATNTPTAIITPTVTPSDLGVTPTVTSTATVTPTLTATSTP